MKRLHFAFLGVGCGNSGFYLLDSKGPPATCERLMERILSGLIWKICLMYLDDIIVFSKTFDEHLENLAELCEKIRSAN